MIGILWGSVKPERVAMAVAVSVTASGCIPFAIDEAGAQLIVVNHTSSRMAGLALPAEQGFQVFPADDRGPGTGLLYTGGEDCKLDKLELTQDGHDGPVATIERKYLCNVLVVYRGPDDISFEDL